MRSVKFDDSSSAAQGRRCHVEGNTCQFVSSTTFTPPYPPPTGELYDADVMINFDSLRASFEYVSVWLMPFNVTDNFWGNNLQVEFVFDLRNGQTSLVSKQYTVRNGVAWEYVWIYH